MSINPPKIESVQYDPTTDTIDRYIKRRITGGSSIYKASLDIMLCHMADFHQMTLELLCSKYGLNLDTVLKDIQEDETYKAMMVHPLMNTLRYLSEEELTDYSEAPDSILSRAREDKPDIMPELSQSKIETTTASTEAKPELSQSKIETTEAKPEPKPKKKRKFKIVATNSPKPEEEDNKTIKITEYMVSREKTNKVAVTKQHL
jgi:hypothetical protein